MAAVADLVAPEHVEALATPSNLRLGQEIVDAGGVELLDCGHVLVRGRVRGVQPGTQRRTSELSAVAGTLAWRCTCTTDPGLFCKHLVALAIASRERASTRR